MACSAQRYCPLCGRPADAKFAPFCSKRCAEVDLSRWLGGKYVMQTDEEPETEEPFLPREKD